MQLLELCNRVFRRFFCKVGVFAGEGLLTFSLFGLDGHGGELGVLGLLRRPFKARQSLVGLRRCAYW